VSTVVQTGNTADRRGTSTEADSIAARSPDTVDIAGILWLVELPVGHPAALQHPVVHLGMGYSIGCIAGTVPAGHTVGIVFHTACTAGMVGTVGSFVVARTVGTVACCRPDRLPRIVVVGSIGMGCIGCCTGRRR